MKRYLIFILAVLVLFALASCDPPPSENPSENDSTPGENESGENTKPNVNAPENTIYGYGIRPSVIFTSNEILDSITTPEINKLNNALQKVYLIWPSLSEDTAPISNHEMVIGDTNREISAAARKLLDEKIAEETASFTEDGIDEDDITGYIIYSNGSSLSVYWKDFQISPIAIGAFIENYIVSNSLILEPGIAKIELFSLSEYLKEREEKLLEEKWAELAEAIPRMLEEYVGGGGAPAGK